ncbi:MAG: hypothetical protein GY769_12770 [bacterium]|nr:hypothetical protein [bacterium]
MTRPLPALLLLALGALVGCGSSTEPLETPLVFEGELAFQGSEFHNFTVVAEGTIRIEVVRLQQKAVEGEGPVGFDLPVGVGLGRPAEDQCQARTSDRANEGDLLVFGLPGAEFCVLVFDVGTLLPDQVVEYALSVSAG